MKKMTLLLMAIVMSLGLIAQDLSYITMDGETPANPKDNEYVCAPGSVFSQIYPTYNYGFFCDDGIDYSRTADDYTTTSSFSGIRFWGTNYCGGPINATEIFVIKFYERNTVNPEFPGAEVSSFTKEASLTDMGIVSGWCNSPIYQVDVDFGTTVTLLDGWMSITRHNPGDNYTFVTIGYNDNNGSRCSYNSANGTWHVGDENLMFCLGDPPPVPLSNWALIISMLLISGFIVIRTRYSAA